jgi:geranylgeranyl diphosphate synthase, type II
MTTNLNINTKVEKDKAMSEELKAEYLQYLTENPFRGNPENLYESMNYIMQLGGKRMRPVLTLMACSICGGDIKKALPAAHAIEVFHNFTLVHDDILDQAPVRRGLETVHVKYSIATAILAGDNMLIKAYQLLTTFDSETCIKLLEVFNKTASQICDGQQMDMNLENELEASEEDYFEMITLKTAVLLGCCLKAGAIIAGANEKDQEVLYNFGIKSGMAFQIMDDWLDAFGDTKLTGKQPGGDILAGKKTLIYLRILKKLPDSQKQSFIQLYQSENMDKVNKVLTIMHEHKVSEEIKNLIDETFMDAEDLLKGFTKGYEVCNPLIQMNKFLRGRNY